MIRLCVRDSELETPDKSVAARILQASLQDGLAIKNSRKTFRGKAEMFDGEGKIFKTHKHLKTHPAPKKNIFLACASAAVASSNEKKRGKKKFVSA